MFILFEIACKMLLLKKLKHVSISISCSKIISFSFSIIFYNFFFTITAQQQRQQLQQQQQQRMQLQLQQQQQQQMGHQQQLKHLLMNQQVKDDFSILWNMPVFRFGLLHDLHTFISYSCDDYWISLSD